MKFRPKQNWEKMHFCTHLLLSLRHQKKVSCFFDYIAQKNKVVHLLSFSHITETVNDGEQKKPQAILDYNATKEVDRADYMLRAYSTKTASRRWPLAAFFNLGHWTHSLYVRIYRYQTDQDVIFSSNSKVFAPQR